MKKNGLASNDTSEHAMCAAVLGKLLKAIIKAQSRKSLPITDGALKLAGLKAPVEVIRDSWGVPHIYAKNNEDLFFAFGFVVAQDRFWQMELHRRIATGRLSEMIGRDALDTDRAIRTFGIHRLAKRDAGLLDQRTRVLFQAYADGVNAWLSHPDTKLPVEFKLIKHVPEQWTVEDSIAFGHFMLWQLQGNWVIEPLLASIAVLVGNDAMREIDPDFSANPGSIQGGYDVNVLQPDGKFKSMKGPYIKQGGGSNAWAVGGSRTASGKPLHFNDPHLGPSTPAIWYLVHLVGGDFNVTGASVPALPIAPIGHNDRCSWTACISCVDGVDLFIEKFNPDDPTRYKYKEGWVDAEVIDEPIKIKGENVPFIEKVVITRHGPVVSGIETLSIHGSKDALAYCSVSRDPSTLVRGGIKLMKARCWDDFIDAGRDLDLYFMHVTYADIDGNIGSHVCCRAPRRVKGHDGQVPVPGWTGEYDWAGEYIPFGELPHALNPKKGFIVVSNNKPFEGHEYPHYLGNAWDAGFRAARITSFIETKGKMALEDLLPLHLDFTSLPGQQFVKRLERFETADPDAKLGLDMVRAWDGVLSADSTGGAVCELAMGFMLRYIFESGLEPEMVPLAMGRSFNPVLKEINEYYYCKPLILFAFLDDPGSWWVKNAGGKQAVIEQGLKRAVYFLRDNVARDPAAWQWGKISKVVFPHAFAMKKPLDLVFNPPSRPFGGNPFTACQSSSDSDKGWGTKRCVPSFRMAIDWSDVSKARCILPPGQSGHLASPHYMDMYDAWLKGEYIPMLWTREQVEAHVEGKLVLSP